MARKRMPRVLVFEDSEYDYVLLSGALQRAGYRGVRATTPEEFLVHAPWTQYALIIVDLFLGDGPAKQAVGIDLTREVRARNKRVPIIVASTHQPSRHEVADSFRAGARDYVDKEALLNDVDGILRRHLQEASDEYSRGAEAELPLPMAFLLRDLRRSKANPRQRLERLIELFEVTLKMIAFGMISANRGSIHDLSEDLRSSFCRPSLGHLSRLINSLTVESGFFRGIAEATHQARFRELTEGLINVRNDFIGHGALQRDAVYIQQLEKHEPALTELIDFVDDFRQFRLVWPEKAKVGAVDNDYDMKVFRGSNPEPESEEISTALRLRSSEWVYFVNEDATDSVPLFPWCQYLVCDQCQNQKLFLYRMERHGELWMIDHVYGHTMQTRNGWQEHYELFGSSR